MTSLFKNKRGLSPLIATILLIAFAVALGAVVMNIGRASIISPSSGSSIFSILDIQGQKQICYFDKGTESLLEFTLKNGAESDLADIQLSIIGKNDVNNMNNLLKQPINTLEVKRIAVKYDGSTTGPISMVILTPIVTQDGQLVPKKDLQLDSIKTC